MAKNFHNGTNIIARQDTIFLREEILEFFVVPTVKQTLMSWHRRFQPFNLERKVWVIEKFWKHIWIQRPKIHQKETFFFMGQNLSWPILSVIGTKVASLMRKDVLQLLSIKMWQSNGDFSYKDRSRCVYEISIWNIQDLTIRFLDVEAFIIPTPLLSVFVKILILSCQFENIFSP